MIAAAGGYTRQPTHETRRFHGTPVRPGSHDPRPGDRRGVQLARRGRAGDRDHDTGAIIATDSGGKARGIVTDRDIVVRAIVDGHAPGEVRVEEICSDALATLNPQDRLDTAAEMMRRHDVRRLPVVEGDRSIGIVSLGDLAIERGEHSALADISAAHRTAERRPGGPTVVRHGRRPVT